jgi:hypothetical protein
MACGLFISNHYNEGILIKRKNSPLSSHIDLNKYFGK